MPFALQAPSVLAELLPGALLWVSRRGAVPLRPAYFSPISGPQALKHQVLWAVSM